MSSFFSPRRIEPEQGEALAGGMAEIGQIFGAAYRQMLYVDNFNARERARNRAIDERNEETYRDTGVRPRNPFRRGDLYGVSEAEKIAIWQREVEEAARRIPDTNVADRLNRSLEGDMQRIARESEGSFERLSASRGGLGGFAAGMGGALLGALRDPLTFASLAFGGGPGAARTIGGRLLTAAMREAAVNGAFATAAQPMVQAWREEAGLPSGTGEALQNILFGTLAGGVFGAAGQGIAEGAGLIARRLPAAERDAAAAELAARPETQPTIRAALEGDAAAAAEALGPIRETLPPLQRGALDAADSMAHLDAVRPGAAVAETHDRAVSTAHRILDADPDDAVPRFQPDEIQIGRVALDILGPAPAHERPPQSLVDFLIGAGGLRDDGGELSFIGAASHRQRGRLVRRDGLSLDMAREAAEEAGYIGRAGEWQSSGINDLIEAIDAELRGRPVYSRADEQMVRQLADHEAALARIEATVKEVAAAHGPGMRDRHLRAAAELAMRENMDPADAMERVLVRAELDGDEVLSLDLDEEAAAAVARTSMAEAKREMAALAIARFGVSEPRSFREVRNLNDGRDIRISKTGIEHMISKPQSRASLAALWRLDDLLALAEHVGSATDRKGRGNIKAIHTYERRIRHAGRPATVRITVRETNAGTFYYHHLEWREGGGPEGRGGHPSRPEGGGGADPRQGPPSDNIARETTLDNLPPGWSDEELLAASSLRGNPPDPATGGLDDPGAVDDAFLISPRDVEELGDMTLPGDDGNPVTLARALEEIEADEGAAALIDACRPGRGT